MIPQRSIWIALIQYLSAIVIVETVSVSRLDALTREQLLDLDRDVSKYYNESYVELDQREPPISYDEQLYRSIRSLRHTVVLNMYDFKYSRNETKWSSIGASVDRELCRRQLRLLALTANKTRHLLMSEQANQIPLSILDFLEASGRTGSGVLNGNFVWLGSHNGCVRSRIPAPVLQGYLGVTAGEQSQQQVANDIKGRYCVAHLRAKSWPKWDDYFEDRLTLKRGVCLPETCHTAVYESDDEMVQLVDYLSRINLEQPFSGERYETGSLYCLPDEDSPHRQMDLGAKLFIAFVSFWILLTIYSNIRYYKRKTAMQKLRETVDIKMIINEKLDDIASNYRDRSEKSPIQSMPNKSMKPPSMVVGEMDKLELCDARGGNNQTGFSFDDGLSSAASSVANTPIPSGIDEDDSDTTDKLISPFSLRKRRKKRLAKANANYHYAKEDTGRQQVIQTDDGIDHDKSDSLDLIRAFAIEPNLEFLLESRPVDKTNATCSQQLTSHSKPNDSCATKRKGSHTLATVARRSSSLNESLVKDLNEQSSAGDHQTGKVAIVSGGHQDGTRCHASDSSSSNHDHEDQAGERFKTAPRVDIDVLDGMKVIATCWIVWGHTMMFFFGLVTDMRFGTERMFDITMLATINTLQVVGLFYIITGCLLTYFSFNRAKLKQLLNPFFWLLVLVGRYIRLIPAYALVFWFARHVAPHTGVGPGFYDYRTDDEHARGYCANESWWVMWTMSAADIKIPMDCVPQAWYLSDDFRTLLVLPIYVLLLAKSTALGYSAIFATFGYSSFKLAQILRVAKIDYRIVLAWHPHVYALMADRLHEVYTNPAVRMSTYLLGVIVGHLLYMYETRYIKQWPSWFRAYAMKLALLMAVGFFLGAPILASPLVNQFLPAREDVDSDTLVWIIPLFKGAMEFSICVVILLLVTGGGFGFVRSILSSKVMKILSNISYAVFLTHVEIMYKLPAFQLDSDYWHLFKHAIFFIVLSHMVAFVLHLFFEIPVHYVTRHLFKKAFKLIS